MTRTPATAEAPDAPARNAPRTGPILGVCLGAGFLTLLDVSIVNVALPSVQASLDAGTGALQWIVAGYTLAFGLTLVPAGRLGDVRGRRTLMLLGLLGFLLSSLVAGAAGDDVVLAVARLVQGASAGVVNPQVIGLLQQHFTGPARARAFGLYGATIGISTAVGPLLGGALIEVAGVESGWRWVFWVNVPVGLLLAAATWRWVPRTAGADAPRRVAGARWLDPVGLGLLATGVLALMLPFVLTTGRDDDPWRWVLLVPGAVLLVMFWRWEAAYPARGGSPVVDVALVRSPPFRWGCLLGLSYFAGFTSIFLVVTVYLQSGLGLTALQAGAVGVPFAIASAITSARSGRWVTRFGRPVVVVGLVLVLVGLVASDVAARATSTPLSAAIALAATQAVAGAGSGLVISPNQSLTLAGVPRSQAGVAGGVLQVGQRIGSAVGVAAVTSVFFSSLAATGMDSQEAYGHALSRGLAVSIVLVVLALVVAAIDSRRRSQADDGGSGAHGGGAEGGASGGPAAVATVAR